MRRACIPLLMLLGAASVLVARGAVQVARMDRKPAVIPGISREIIRVDARVVDGDGKSVTGLKADDFEIYQYGRP